MFRNALGTYSEDDYLKLMARGWSGGLNDGTPCGSGSRIASTESVRARLPDLAEGYGIRTVCDAGAGDLHWMKLVKWDVDYQPFDLQPRHWSVKKLDIRREALPACDLILCRWVLGHMNPENVLRTLELFRQSAKYLLATQHDVQHRIDAFDSYNHWNLTMEPFSLGEPLERIPDHKDSTFSLWRLQ